MFDKTWITVANKSCAYIFEQAENKGLELITEFQHPEGRMREGEFNSDGSGGSSLQGTIREHQSVNHEDEIFAGQINEYLERGRNNHSFNSLILVAPPHFLGILKFKLSKQLHKLVSRTISKDFPNPSVEQVTSIL